MNNDHPLLPQARTSQLIVKESDDEVLVYDLRTDQAHCLNKTAAVVWKNCDGTRSIDDIRAALQDGRAVPVDESMVWLAIDQLEKVKLLDQAPMTRSPFSGLNRRQIMRSLGVATLALPVVVSMIAPTPASAISCVNPGGLAPGSTCTNKGQCCTDICSGGATKTCG